MKKIKHNDLTHYFLADHKDLPAAYLASCEEFFKACMDKKTINIILEKKGGKLQASSTKPQASSLTEPGPSDSNRIIKEKLC